MDQAEDIRTLETLRSLLQGVTWDVFYETATIKRDGVEFWLTAGRYMGRNAAAVISGDTICALIFFDRGKFEFALERNIKRFNTRFIHYYTRPDFERMLSGKLIVED